jgi:hypothetical protein
MRTILLQKESTFVVMTNFHLIFIGLMAISCASAQPQAGPEMLDHSAWTNLLQKHVSDEGHVDYAGFEADSLLLNEYLNTLSSHHPDSKTWSKDGQLAYWINVYNAYTVKLIVDHYPVVSIKDIGGKLYKINTAWDVKFIELGGEVYDLNNVEHGILRKEFAEPRIHFAINCASISCPKLHNKAYEAKDLDQQLTEAAESFINDSSKNIITKDKAELSKLFSWFKGDFTEEESLVEFINTYSDVPLDEDVKIDHLDYDWNLNGE